MENILSTHIYIKNQQYFQVFTEIYSKRIKHKHNESRLNLSKKLLKSYLNDKGNDKCKYTNIFECVSKRNL